MLCSLALDARASSGAAARRGRASRKGPAAGKTVKVGVIADVTGSAAVYGTMQKNAYELANDDIKTGIIDAGGANLSFDVEDAASDGAQVVNLMQKFTTDGTTPLVLGPTLSGEAFKRVPDRESRELSGDGHVDDGRRRDRDRTDASSATRSPNRKRSRRPSRKVQQAGTPRRVAIIYGDDNAFTKTDGDLFTREFEKTGATVVDTETFHIGDKDFGPALTKIASKKPDVDRDRRPLPRGDADHRAGRQARHQSAHDRRQRAQLDADVSRPPARRRTASSSARRGSSAASTPATSSS